jgi:hypothetical protein
MLTNIVGWVLLILASSMSAMQMVDGGAVNACKLIVSSVLSGSSDTIRTVWSSHPTAWQYVSNDRTPRKTTYQIRRSLASLGYLSYA